MMEQWICSLMILRMTRSNQSLFSDKEHYYNEFMGIFICNVKTNEEAYERFRKWVDDVLNIHRDKAT